MIDKAGPTSFDLNSTCGQGVYSDPRRILESNESRLDWRLK